MYPRNIAKSIIHLRFLLETNKQSIGTYLINYANVIQILTIGLYYIYIYRLTLLRIIQ